MKLKTIEALNKKGAKKPKEKVLGSETGNIASLPPLGEVKRATPPKIEKERGVEEVKKIQEIREELGAKPDQELLRRKTGELNDLEATQKELKSRITAVKEEYKELFESESTIVNWVNWALKKTDDGRNLDEAMKEEIAFLEEELRATEEPIKEVTEETEGLKNKDGK